MTVIEIVREYLEKNGFDGLFNEQGECACELNDLAPCGEIGVDCEAGYKVDCDPETCPMDGNCTFHIIPGKPVKEVEND